MFERQQAVKDPPGCNDKSRFLDSKKPSSGAIARIDGFLPFRMDGRKRNEGPGANRCFRQKIGFVIKDFKPEKL